MEGASSGAPLPDENRQLCCYIDTGYMLQFTVEPDGVVKAEPIPVTLSQ